ncbi:hypothetical protein LOTGIDRAFT_153600 [Lottia gigantea]|uniref:Sushi domain-containing protein n=1 Tax=Lottia gigantea TaxID=225164 RepID=V4BQJ9_LOTGI|nr:hypothetical protein LOTGIDRAFT_153600 [Lottia gigantea]ESO91169.1 hypothetical protein LOTGIDRAFT_153600 [Lottia gigantea]
MNTIVCSISLLSVTTLILIDADCAGYPNENNADFHRNEQCSDIVEITCSDGYKMEAAIECKSEIQFLWKYKRPVCKLDPKIENGALDTDIASRDIGIEYSYTCNPGFGKYGNEGHVICNEAGEWEADITCEGQCMSDPEIENGALDTDIASRDIGIEYSYTCNPGFGKYGNDGLVICTEAREWEANITCEDCFKYYTENTYLTKSPYATPSGRLNQVSCQQSCTNDDRCTASFVSFQSCELHGIPAISISHESRAECRTKCVALADCKLMSWNSGSFPICTLFNVTKNNLPSKHQTFSRNGAFIGENLCK